MKKLFEPCANFPATYFAVPLGLGAFSASWYKAKVLYSFALPIHIGLGVLATFTWFFLFSVYVFQFKYCRKNFLAEYHHPIRFAFIALIPVSALKMGEIWHLWGWGIMAKMVIFSAIFIQVIYGVWKLGGLLKGNAYSATDPLPVFYIPAMAGNFTSGSALMALGYGDWATLFLGAGLIAWVVFEPVLLQNLRTQTTPEAFRPSFGILFAPAFVGGSAYLSIQNNEIDFFMKGLLGYGCLQLLFYLRIFNWIAEKNIDFRFWSASFGISSMIGISVIFQQKNILPDFTFFLFWFGNFIMLALIAYSVYLLVKGQFFK